MTDKELRAEAKRRGYTLIPSDRLRLLSAIISVVDEDGIANIAEDNLIGLLGSEIAEKLVEFNKIAWRPVDRCARMRSASARFYIVVPRDAETPL